jgi:hypothetical protein
MKLRTLDASAAIAALILTACLSLPAAAAAVDSLPGFDTATDMKSWLKLTDDQVAKLQPVVAARITGMDAALAKVENSDQPDVLGFAKDYGVVKTQFNDGVAAILTPDQLKQWNSFQAAAEKDLVQGLARKQLAGLQPALKLTDDQATKLLPAMVTATQGKVDVLNKLASTGRIGMRDKLQAKRSMDDINTNLVKAMSAVCSPDQVSQYQAIQAAKKKK